MAKILLADDMIDLLESEQELLEETGLGYDVKSAQTAEQTLDMLSRETFDLVILDVMIPRRGGLETLREIVAKYKVPVIIYSAYLNRVPGDILLKEGAKLVMTKPAPIDFFLNSIKSVLQPESKSTFVIVDGYKIKEIQNDTLTGMIQTALANAEGSMNSVAKTLELSEECLQFLIKKLKLNL